MLYEQEIAELGLVVPVSFPHRAPAQPPQGLSNFVSNPASNPANTDDAGLPQQLLLATLDEVGHGLAVLDIDGRVRWSNRMALRFFQRSRKLAVQRHHLVAESAADAQALQRALAAACHGRRGMVKLGGGDAATMLALVPLPPADARELPCALLVLSRQEACEPLSLQFFSSTHQLTSAEAGVLDALSRGRAPLQVAAAGRVAMSTVRTQISSVRQKTGARNIAHLLRMVASLPPLVSAVDDCTAQN